MPTVPMRTEGNPTQHLSLDRRKFLGTSAALGSTFGFFTSTARAQEVASANEQLTVAVMGVNNQGLTHLRNFAQQPSAEVAYICEVDDRVVARALQEVAKYQKRKPRVVRDLREVLDDPAVDILSIAAPNHWHAPATIMACAAGKHVYVEKPCSYSAEEGELAVRAARNYDRVVQMGTQRRSRAPIVEAIQKLHDGVIGRVLLARTWYYSRRQSIGVGKQVAVPSELDYDLWQGPATTRPYKDNLVHYNWHFHWHWGNGELGNNGIHAIDIARWGLGVEYPTRVSSTGDQLRLQGDQETPDTHHVAFYFGEQMITWEGVSWSPYGPGGIAFGIVFHGEDGTMELDDSGYRIYDMRKKEIQNVAGTGGDPEHYANFLEAIRQAKRPSADIEEAHKSTLLCHLGNIAHRTGRTLRTDPQNGHTLDDSDAQELWSRQEYREGFNPNSFL